MKHGAAEPRWGRLSGEQAVEAGGQSASTRLQVSGRPMATSQIGAVGAANSAAFGS